jgi:ABC-type spermidine/putrescine transport system permease subunit II
LLLGFPAALALDRASFPGKALFRRLVLLPLILPGIITGLSLLMLFVTAGHEAQPADDHAGTRHRADLRCHHGNLRGLAN